MTICAECKDKGILKKDFPLDRLICSKCSRISLTGSMPMYTNTRLNKIHSYIWCNGIENHGITWFRKARDKLIKELEEQHIKWLTIEEKEEIKDRKMVERWLKA